MSMSNGYCYLVDVKLVPKESTKNINFLFGFPHLSQKSFAKIISDSAPYPISKSILANLDLKESSLSSLVYHQIKHYLDDHPICVFRLYQGKGYSRPHIKFIGHDSISIKSEILPLSDYSFSWGPKELIKNTPEEDQALALDYLIKTNPTLFNGAKTYEGIHEVPDDSIPLDSLFKGHPEVLLAYGTNKIYQKIDIVKRSFENNPYQFERIQGIIKEKIESLVKND